MRKNKNINESLQQGFSLMEMMVVLLIVAIIAAASAPMVTKKMSRNAGTGDSPWVFTGLKNNIAFLGDQVLIGSTSRPTNAEKARLYIAGGDGKAHIGYGNADNSSASFITYEAANADGQTTRIGLTNVANVPNDSIMFGGNQQVENDSNEFIAIGTNTENKSSQTITIGHNAIAGDDNDTIGAIAIGTQLVSAKEGGVATLASGLGSIAIGTEAEAIKTHSVAIGFQAKSGGTVDKEDNIDTTAIGVGAKAYGKYSTAIGTGAEVGDEHEHSTAIGAGAKTTTKNQIVLGTASDTVYIPGRLVVCGAVALNTNWDSWNSDGNRRVWIAAPGGGLFIGRQSSNNGAPLTAINWSSFNDYSDRRLKNVGKTYTAGLEELKKLELFHYTFKDDKAKTPHVGVMAQDLQKVFPDAVTEGKDGYLRIRTEDMFYAVINAVKELNAKINSILEDITGMKTTIAEQQKTIEELQKQNAEFEKRLKKLEKRYK